MLTSFQCEIENTYKHSDDAAVTCVATFNCVSVDQVLIISSNFKIFHSFLKSV
jgi:hypothetical protein